MLLVQASDSILIDFIGHVFYDISNSFACNWALDRPGVENIKIRLIPLPFSIVRKSNVLNVEEVTLEGQFLFCTQQG